MQVPVHTSTFVIGQPINPISWPRKLPKPAHISVNVRTLSSMTIRTFTDHHTFCQTARRPASADSTCTVSSTSSSPVSPLPSSPSTTNLNSQSRSETEVQRAVSRLLSLTKQLQDVLNLWAHGSAYEEDVSDAYVLIGSQFDATVHAFWRAGVDLR